VLEQVQAQLALEDVVRAFEAAFAVETGEAEAERIVGEEIEPRIEEPALRVERLFTEKRKATPGNFEQTVPGFALMFTFWLSLFVAASIYSEKREYHTWRRTLTAPVPRIALVGSRVLAYTGIGMVQITLLFVLGWALFGISLGDHPYALLPIFFAMTLATAAFGFLMTSLVRDIAVLSSLMNLIVIIAAAAGGTLVPLFLLPDWLRAISPAVPHYWAMSASQDVILLGDGLVHVLPAVAALLGFAAAFLALGLWRFRFVD
jgi:ABC-2 type transport system permease protein